MLTAGLAVQLSSVPNPNPIKSMLVILQTVAGAKNAECYHVLYCRAIGIYTTQPKPQSGYYSLFYHF
jgi:hypothetical protein